jgi:hypothetical protein
MRSEINIRISFANIETECLSSSTTIGCLHFGVPSTPAQISWINYSRLTGPTATTAVGRFLLPAVRGRWAYSVSGPAIFGWNRNLLMWSLITVGGLLCMKLSEGACCVLFRWRSTSQRAPGIESLDDGIRMTWQCLLRGLVAVGILIVIILSLIARVARIRWLI